MKNTILILLPLFIILFEVYGQSPERPKKEIPLLSEVVSSLDKSTGWILQNNGEWVSSSNRIPFKEYNLNEIKKGRYLLGQENFTVIEIRQVTVNEVIYSIMIIKFQDGKYDFPLLEQGWHEFKTLKYFAFREEKWNSIFPDSIAFNKPYAVNMQLLTSGTIPQYNEKTYLFEIENSVQKAIYLQEESVSNMIFAVYPVEINGKKLIRFKHYETINKFEIYVKFLLEHNWLKLFRNSYYEIDFGEFANFILNIGVIDPAKLNNPEYYTIFFESGIKKYNEEKFVTALQLFMKAGMVNPPDSSLISINLWKGKCKLQLRLFDEAIADFNQALKLTPITNTEKKDFTEAYFQRGNGFYNILEYSKACQDWQTALEMGFEDALRPIKKYCGKSLENGSLAINVKKSRNDYNKAIKKYNQQEYLKAQFLFEKSWQNNPVENNFKTHYYIGMCRFNLGDYVRSIDDFDKAYRFRPDTIDREFFNWLNVIVWRGKAYQQCGYINQACEDWNEAKRYGSIEATEFYSDYCFGFQSLKKNTPAAKNTLLENGIKAYKSGNLEEAIIYFDKVIESDTSDSNLISYSYRGSARHKLKDYHGAIEDFSQVINKKPANKDLEKTWDEAFYNRGVSKFYLSDLDGACKDWQEALNLGIKEAQFLLKSYCENRILPENRSENENFKNTSPKNDDTKLNDEPDYSPDRNNKPVNSDDKKSLKTFIKEIDTFNNSVRKSPNHPEKK